MGRPLGMFLALCLGAALPMAARADVSFKGKTIFVLIGPGNAGSGYDLYGRLLARHLGRHLPGEPNVIAQNMPGGAGLALANHLFNVAPRDGTVVGMISEIAPLSEMLGIEGVRYKSSQLNWLGRATSSVSLTMTWRTSKVRTLAEAMETPITLSTGPVGGLAYQMPALLNSVFGARFKLVQGYPSTMAMQLAMERGETDGAFGDWTGLQTTRGDWLRDHLINLLVQYGLEREPDLKDTPAAMELARNESERQLLRLAFGGTSIGRSLVAPPGVPTDVLQVLRDAVLATANDPALRDEATRAVLPIAPLAGAPLQEIVAGITAAPPEVVARARDIMGRR